MYEAYHSTSKTATLLFRKITGDATFGSERHDKRALSQIQGGRAMRAVIQRVSRASVTVDGATVGEIGPGWLVLLGVARDDNDQDADRLAEKVVNIRAFNDEQGKMNRSVVEAGGAVLVVSQFTLLGDCRGGRRPGFTEAAEPGEAERLYLRFNERVAEAGVEVATGVFRAHMNVELVNDGPVTFLLDSRKLF
jgi:D-aminoacyl-tRNA deacylase